jgi:hypothetical protein
MGLLGFGDEVIAAVSACYLVPIVVTGDGGRSVAATIGAVFNEGNRRWHAARQGNGCAAGFARP